MLLNQSQQKRLFDIANGRAGGGVNQVEFHISGKDLRGVLRNNEISNSRIKAGL